MNMKKACTYRRLLFIVTLIIVPTYCVSKLERVAFMPHAYGHILHENGKPSPALLELLTLLNVTHDGSLQSIVQATQQQWLRKPGSERWDMQEVHADKQAHILELLHNLGCIDTVNATQQQYDYALLLGATVSRVRTRLAYLLDQWQQGVRFKYLIFLGSERPLDAKIESADLLRDLSRYPYADHDWSATKLPTTEYQMMRMVFDQTELPADFEKVIVIFINTPQQLEPNGTWRRANTMDTIREWLAQQPKPGSTLVVSNQPYVGYQDAVVRTGLPSTFSVETIGHRVSDNEKIAVYLDTVARWIYQENVRHS